MKKIIISICVVLVLGIALGVRAFQQPVNPDQLARLQRGMSKAEVEAVLGVPTKAHPSGQWTW